VEQLRRFEENEYELNGFLVAQLNRLKAVEAAELIERALASNRVAVDICGYWGDIRDNLGVPGLGLAPDEPPRPPRPPEPRSYWRDSPSPGTLDHARQREREKKAKAKRKQQEICGHTQDWRWWSLWHRARASLRLRCGTRGRCACRGIGCGR